MEVREKVEKVFRSPNELPAGWQKATLAEVAEIIMGQSPSSQYYNSDGEGLPFFQGKAEFGELYPKPVKWCSQPNKVAQKDDVLMSVRAPVGPTNLTISECCIGRGLAAIRSRDGVQSRYVLYYLRSIESGLDALGTGTTFKAISGGILRSIPIPIAPTAQQERIVAEIEKQFSRLNEAVANLKRAKANLKRYKAAVLKAAVEGKFVSSDPSGWTRTSLGTVLTTIEAGRSFKCAERLPSIRQTGVVKVSAVTWGTYNEEESKTCLDPGRIETRYFIKPGDFLFSRANTIQLVGACVIAQKVTRKIMLSDKILRFHFSDTVVPQWVLYWLRSDIGRKEIQRLSTGNQESMRNIGQDRIRQIAFALPGLEEQRTIVAEVERRLSVIEELETAVQANLTRADRLRQAILASLFCTQSRNAI